MLLYTTPLPANAFIFFREHIYISIIHPDTLLVSGTYWFINQNRPENKTTIFYPFPVDSTELWPAAISAYYTINKKPIQFDKLANGVVMQIEVEKRDTVPVTVQYKQRVTDTRGRYIVSTTELWNRPLQSAEFTLVAPPDILVTYWSDTCDSVYTVSDTVFYYSKKRMFLPSSDLFVHWISK